MNFDFACGHTRFVAIHAEGGEPGRLDFPGYGTPEGTLGPREEELAFLDERLSAADEPNRVVLVHQPPYLDGHYAPHPDWGFRRGEREFLDIVRRHGVRLVCCAHGLAFDHTVHDGVHFVMSGAAAAGSVRIGGVSAPKGRATRKTAAPSSTQSSSRSPRTVVSPAA
jgi:hypothetical protein